MNAPIYNWQQKGWPRFTYNRAHLSDELSAFADAFRKVKKALRPKQDPELIAVGAGPQTRYRLAVDLGEPIEGINEGINEKILRLIKTHPGTRVPYLHSVVTASQATVERVLSALIAEGRIEHRGSKKTGGYYVK